MNQVELEKDKEMECKFKRHGRIDNKISLSSSSLGRRE